MPFAADHSSLQESALCPCHCSSNSSQSELRQKLCKTPAVGGKRLLAVCPDTPCPQADVPSPPSFLSATIKAWQAALLGQWLLPWGVVYNANAGDGPPSLPRATWAQHECLCRTAFEVGPSHRVMPTIRATAMEGLHFPCTHHTTSCGAALLVTLC